MKFLKAVLLISIGSSLADVSKCPRLCANCPCGEGQEFDTHLGAKFEGFLGIPYAQPPVGNLRFKNPVPLRKYPLIADLKEPSKCMQRNFYQWRMFTTGEEDCLYLNIFRPQHLYENMPVFVYFPHGDLMYGSGSYYDTAPDQILQNRLIILVVIQYRVGVLGFLSTGDANAPGNYGLKDQEMGLAWVKQNIGSFSGDPNNITVFGDLTVQYQLMRPTINFQQAIISGSYVFSYFNGLGAQTQREALELAQRLGAELDYDPLANAELMSQLRNESIDRIMDVAGDVMGAFHFPFHIYGPTLEQNSATAFLSDIPSKLWTQIKHDIPIMIGYSHFYGYQMARALEDIAGCMKRMKTRDAIKLLLNVNSDSIVDELAFKYLFENTQVFQISAKERDKYALMLSERYYEQPLMKTIVDYNNNVNIESKQLYLYVVDFRADTNAGEAEHLFKPDPYAEQTGKVNHILELFESFIAHRHPPAGPCVTTEAGLQCPYVKIGEDGAVVNYDAFTPVATDFWNQFAPLPYQNWQ